MKWYWRFLVLFFNHEVFSQNISVSENSRELIAVAVIFRHGDRSPFRSYPNDKYFNESYWPNGLGGEMTKYGIQRMYKLGQFLRQRYNDFLGEIYSSNEVYAYSPDYNRCLISITATLAGLYPPKGRQIWNDKLLWQPVPVHSQSLKSEEILTQKRYCPKYRRLIREVKTNQFEFLQTKYKNFLELINNKTGWNNVDFKKVGDLRSVLYTYRNYNISFLPEWYPEVEQNLDYFAEVKHALPTSTRALTRLRVGPLYDFVFKYFNTFIKASPGNHSYKFLLMSAQGISISSTLDGMDCFQRLLTGFGDAIIWELKKKNEQYFLNLMYRADDKLEQLDCCHNCDYEIFQKNLNDVTVDIDLWIKECFVS